MKCPKCNNELFIAFSKMESELESTEVFAVHKLVCTNAKCSNYCGTDLKNPKIIVQIVKNKV